MTRTKQSARKSKRPKRTKEEWDAMKKENPELGQYKLAPRTNPTFEAYYKGIGIIPEGEWDQFLDKMREPLPATFRITGSRSQAQELLKIIKGQYFKKFMAEVHGEARIQPKPLTWYPDEMAWQLDFTKKEIRQNNTLKSLHGFLISETESGNISRQEAVSMLPPLLLDIKPHHKILDMCAAPGSKTAQLIEMLHGDDNVPVPDGFVVANDMDNKRCYLMTHQVKRIQSPNCMIINHDARILPNLATSTDGKPEFVKYDRILCDVPCSGDGTLRKNPDIWSKWHTNGGYNLHRIQKKILQRGIDLLAVGGRLVYSTCSLNPVENEAVILTILKKYAGAVELVDVSDQLPGLVYSKGTYSWKIMTKKKQWYETVDQAASEFRNAWDDTMYPPIITEAQDAKLERCIRVLPHQQNTGAFFIAVLQKTQDTGRAQKLDPPIEAVAARAKRDGPEFDKKYFKMDVTTKQGRYAHAECLLCKITLMKQRDYYSHGDGKKHKKAVEIALGRETQTAPNVCRDNESSMEIGTGKSEAENASTAGADIKPADDVKKEADAKIKDEPKKDSINGATQEGSQEGTDQGAEGDGAEGAPPAKRPRVEGKGEDEEIPVRVSGHREDPYHFCQKDDPIWPKIKKYFNIADTMDVEQMMFRNMKRVLYYVSKPVRNLVVCNRDRVKVGLKPVRNLVVCNRDRVKFINLGVKCFSNAPSPLVPDSDYRLSQEGLQAVEKQVLGRRVMLTRADLIIMLSQENPFICKLSEMAQEQTYSIVPGSSIFEFNPSESDPEPRVRIVFCGWRGKTTVRSFVSRDERSHYLRLCGVELTDIQAKVQEEKVIKELEDSPPSTEVKEEAAMGTSGTATPMGGASGDEEEVKKWNEGEAPPRGTEVDEQEDSNGKGAEG